MSISNNDKIRILEIKFQVALAQANVKVWEFQQPPSFQGYDCKFADGGRGRSMTKEEFRQEVLAELQMAKNALIRAIEGKEPRGEDW